MPDFAQSQDLPVLRYGDWRLWLEEDSGPRALLSGIGEFTPRITNGTIVVGQLGCNPDFIAHITNVPRTEKFLAFQRKVCRVKKPKSPKKISALVKAIKASGLDINDLL